MQTQQILKRRQEAHSRSQEPGYNDVFAQICLEIPYLITRISTYSQCRYLGLDISKISTDLVQLQCPVSGLGALQIVVAGAVTGLSHLHDHHHLTLKIMIDSRYIDNNPPVFLSWSPAPGSSALSPHQFSCIC